MVWGLVKIFIGVVQLVVMLTLFNFSAFTSFAIYQKDEIVEALKITINRGFGTVLNKWECPRKSNS